LDAHQRFRGEQAGNKLLATYNPNGVYFAVSDWLGSKRAEIGTYPLGCLTTYFSLPYGNAQSDQTSSVACPDATEHHFTGKERDTESGNDYFEARYYSSSMGRFMSPVYGANWAIRRRRPCPGIA
jgi:RHS repeat-associated protein